MNEIEDRLKVVLALCGRHKATAVRPQKAESIDLLWATLEAMRGSGAPDYSIARVGRELALRGGPRTQSMRNPNGEYLREIITAYAEAVQKPRMVQAVAATNADRALAMIPDPNVRYVLTLELARGRKLAAENDQLRLALREMTLVSARTTAPVGSTPSEATMEIMRPNEQLGLTPECLLALRTGIDHDRLDELSLFMSEDGAISDQHGVMLFAPGFVEAIQTVIRACETEQGVKAVP